MDFPNFLLPIHRPQRGSSRIIKSRLSPESVRIRLQVLQEYVGTKLPEGIGGLIESELKSFMGLRDFTGGVDFGSCQYDSVGVVYALWVSLWPRFPLEGRLHGFNIDFIEIKSSPLERFKRYLVREINEVFEYGEEDGKRFLTAIKNATSLDPLFEIMKEMAWDLWGACLAAEENVVGITLFGEPPISEAAKNWPVINQMIQSDNYVTGIVCGLLTEFGLIKNEDSFKDFST